MATAHRYEDLDCWQLADQLKMGVFELINEGKFARDKRLRDQIRESSSSSTSNIGEGFGRCSNAEFVHFLDIARASLNETRNHLRDALALKYVTRSDVDELFALSRRALGAVSGLQSYLRGRLRRHGGKAGIPFNARPRPRSYNPGTRPGPANSRTRPAKNNRRTSPDETNPRTRPDKNPPGREQPPNRKRSE
jgi:four helix bundle protein